ncbi:33484_t:CDS:2, partial [Gigaspora margarita]
NSCSKNYDKAKKKALKMEEYNRNKHFGKQKDLNILEKSQQSNKTAALTINHIEKEKKLNHDDIKNMVKNIVTKTMMNLNKTQNQLRNNKPHTCYFCQQEGHIIKNCSKRNKKNNQTNK